MQDRGLCREGRDCPRPCGMFRKGHRPVWRCGRRRGAGTVSGVCFRGGVTPPVRACTPPRRRRDGRLRRFRRFRRGCGRPQRFRSPTDFGRPASRRVRCRHSRCCPWRKRYCRCLFKVRRFAARMVPCTLFSCYSARFVGIIRTKWKTGRRLCGRRPVFTPSATQGQSPNSLRISSTASSFSQPKYSISRSTSCPSRQSFSVRVYGRLPKWP